MSKLKIELLGSPLLRQKAEEVVEIDDELRTLIADMYETMYEAEGIGLAGPQVGIAKRVLVVDLNDEEFPRFALVNPRIVERGGDDEKEEEGCLSLPGVSALVERKSRVTVEALDEEGHPVRMEADGLLARCLQHEIDHLDGVLFIDHLSALKRSMLVKKYKSQQAEKSDKGREKAAGRSG
ncbi:MAG: peptide deformylase [Gemmatimonadota bacterium]